MAAKQKITTTTKTTKTKIKTTSSNSGKRTKCPTCGKFM